MNAQEWETEPVPRGGTPRRRDSEATREAILEAARKSFGRAGYDQVGLRKIAAMAGVDVALVSRYFGSKEALFAAALAAHSEPDIRFPTQRAGFGEWLVRRLTDRRADRDPARLLILHHSVSNPRAAELIRDLVSERVVGPLARWLGGQDAELRAGLILSQLVGFGLLRSVVRLNPLAGAELDRLIDTMAPAIQAYVDMGDAVERLTQK